MSSLLPEYFRLLANAQEAADDFDLSDPGDGKEARIKMALLWQEQAEASAALIDYVLKRGEEIKQALPVMPEDQG